MPWADPDEVKDVTGSQVSEAQILSAQFIVELFAGTTEEASEAGNISSRNQRMLTMATCYQAAWMPAHPDIFTNIDLTNLSQDGASGQMAHANARLLAPLAKRCLDRLSWANEPLRIRGPNDFYPDRSPRDSAVHDDSRVWAPGIPGVGY